MIQDETPCDGHVIGIRAHGFYRHMRLTLCEHFLWQAMVLRAEQIDGALGMCEGMEGCPSHFKSDDRDPERECRLPLVEGEKMAEGHMPPCFRRITGLVLIAASNREKATTA